MGQLAPDLADQINKVHEGKTVIGTKVGYVSVFRHWFNWNLDYGLDPFETPLDPEKCIFWIQSRVNRAGNISSKKTWTAVLNWISELAQAPCLYKQDIRYITYWQALNKQYETGQDQRLPFKLKHIKKYTEYKWKIAKDKKGRVVFDNLVDILIINCYFFTMSRPCELLKAGANEARLMGLKVRDCQRRIDAENRIPMMEFTIRHYKNQASRKITKKIYFADSSCKRWRQCICKRLNPYLLFDMMMKRRKNLIKEIHGNIISGSLSEDEYITEKHRLDNLALTGNNPAFVYSNGKQLTTKILARLAKEVTQVNAIINPQHYTPYSLRIGGTTKASLADLGHPLILKYVGWSTSRLADCAQRYMRYSPSELAQVPYQMIHGSKDQNKINKKAKKNPHKIYDPWSEKLNMKYYKM